MNDKYYDKSVTMPYDEFLKLHDTIEDLKENLHKVKDELKNNKYHIVVMEPKVISDKRLGCRYTYTYNFIDDKDMEDRFYSISLSRLEENMESKRKESYSKALDSNWFTRLFKSRIIKVLLSKNLYGY